MRRSLALRGAAGVAIPFAVGAAVGHPAEGAIAAAGALPAGVAGFAGGFRSRAATIGATAAGMAVSTFVGGLVAGHVTATIVVLAIWGFAAGICVVLGRDATIVGVQAVMGLIVFGRFPGSVASSAVHAGWVLAGGGFQAVLAAAFRPPQRFVSERRTLAQAFTDLARLAQDPSRSAITAATEADDVPPRSSAGGPRTRTSSCSVASRTRPTGSGWSCRRSPPSRTSPPSTMPG